MVEFFKYGFWFLSGGLMISVVYNIILIKKLKIGNTIEIKKQVQKNRRSSNNRQEYQANQELNPDSKNKKKFKLFKNRKKNGTH